MQQLEEFHPTLYYHARAAALAAGDATMPSQDGASKYLSSAA